MELVYDLWHLAFANLVQRHAPPNFEVRTEVRLSIEPQRADMLLLRRIGALRQDDTAEVLRGLWPRLGLITVLEFKSPVDSSFRPGDLLRLWGYGVLYHTVNLKDLPRPSDLTLVLVVASVTPTLRAEIAMMGWTLEPLGGGYSRIDGAVYAVHVAVTDEVSQAEKDEFLALFSHSRATQGEATRWLEQWLTEKKMKQQDIEEMPGYKEVFQKLLQALPLEQRLAGLAPEQRLAGLAPEQRLAGLTPEEQLLALSDEVLRSLPDEYLRSLPDSIREIIRLRIGRPSGP